MNYIDEIFKRCDINGISNYLLHGGEITEIEQKNYYERVKAADKKLNNWLSEQFTEFTCLDRQTAFVYSIISEIQSVYMQIGLRAGIKLATDYFTKK